MSRFGERYGSVDRFQQRHAWLGFPLAVRQKYSDDQCGYLAATIAHHGLLALLGGGVVLSTLLAGASTATASYGIATRIGGVVLSLLVNFLLFWAAYHLLPSKNVGRRRHRPRATDKRCGRRHGSRNADTTRRLRSPSTSPARTPRIGTQP